MKKIIITLVLTLMTSSVFAYSCPALWTELDYEINLAKNSGMSEEKLKEIQKLRDDGKKAHDDCLLYTSPSPRDLSTSRMPSSA